ncbi:c-type cytochrome domain-containing protein [Planctomicrobium sp. SH668]|uniref:c-type cytochrome domain-containing protein n=1 Tax=Planctomicrobium sp. SH668 TaxID=3448126 RepID=UPI003F5CA945
MRNRMLTWPLKNISFYFLAMFAFPGGFVFGGAEPAPDFENAVAPLFQKYCSGCHNDSSRDGKFSLESYASLMEGIENKPALLPGDANGSLLWNVIKSGGQPQMPPEGEPAPSSDELDIIRAWIDHGATGPQGMEHDRLSLKVPQIPVKTELSPITAVSLTRDSKAVALGRYGRVEIRKPAATGQPAAEWPVAQKLEGLHGKVVAVRYLNDHRNLVTASGVTGSGGIATLWDLETGERIRDFKGHRDIILDIEVSPDQSILATCSYDREIILWDLHSGEQLRKLSGHNGAVYDIAFNPAGTILASASADSTCKLFRVSDGERLDTLGQPLKEQYQVLFSKDGESVIAAGADNQIRIWKVQPATQPSISPLLNSRFAHESAIVGMCLTEDGSQLVTAAEDKTIKVWDLATLTEKQLIGNQPAIVNAIDTDGESSRLMVARLDGSWDLYDLQRDQSAASETMTVDPGKTPRGADAPVQELVEAEPNDLPEQAQRVPVPSVIRGTIYRPDLKTDVDSYLFTAAANEEWVIEIQAARDGSELDSFVEVLTPDGHPVARILLQATRESYFTFRGKDGNQVGDFRIFQWEHMDLNDLLYCNGEVVKLWRAPQGPDSGFDVYPGSGARWGFYDTTGTTHALNEPCYVVQPHPPGTSLTPNGLPEFTLYYENDDGARRETGRDSKLFFTAPKAGDYILRIRDVRGNQSEKSTYLAKFRRAAPDFAVHLNPQKLAVPKENSREVHFRVDRFDQFDGPITVEITGLPPSMKFHNPLVVQEGQLEAFGAISVSADAASLTPEQIQGIKIIAKGTVNGNEVVHDVASFEELNVEENRVFTVAVAAAEGGAVPLEVEDGKPQEFEIHPGETIMLKVVAKRDGFADLIQFGNADSGRNLPHGVIVDNIGLNGLMMLEQQSEQIFFLTCADWVPEQSRLFHLRSIQGGVTTLPVWLHVRRPVPQK